MRGAQPLRHPRRGAVANLTVAVAVDPPDRQRLRGERVEDGRRHRAADDVAAADDQVEVLVRDVGEHRAERGHVPVDVVERGDPRHDAR